MQQEHKHIPGSMIKASRSLKQITSFKYDTQRIFIPESVQPKCVPQLERDIQVQHLPALLHEDSSEFPATYSNCSVENNS